MLSPPSGSLAVYVPTVVVLFSSMVTSACPVTSGGSSTSVTLTVTVMLSVRPYGSEAVTMIS